MKQVFLVPNFTKEGTLAVADQVVPQLLSLGFSLLCEEETARRLGPQAQHCQVMPYGECLDRCDLILVLGGDGSILRIAADAARHSCPVLGIKTGNIGFMSELDAHELHYLEDLAQGRYTIDRRLMLDVSIQRGGECIYVATLLSHHQMASGAADQHRSPCQRDAHHRSAGRWHHHRHAHRLHGIHLVCRRAHHRTQCRLYGSDADLCPRTGGKAFCALGRPGRHHHCGARREPGLSFGRWRRAV